MLTVVKPNGTAQAYDREHVRGEGHGVEIRNCDDGWVGRGRHAHGAQIYTLLSPEAWFSFHWSVSWHFGRKLACLLAHEINDQEPNDPDVLIPAITMPRPAALSTDPGRSFQAVSPGRSWLWGQRCYVGRPTRCWRHRIQELMRCKHHTLQRKSQINPMKQGTRCYLKFDG